MKNSKPLPAEIYKLEEAVGNFMQYWGFKKIHGRIWVHLFTANQPLDSEELMKRLQVSKGLMSVAMRDLLQYAVIKQTSTGKHGTVFYTANEDIQTVISDVLKKREAQTLRATKSILEKLAKLKQSEFEKHNLDSEKINAVLDLTTSASGLLNFFLAQPDSQGADIFNSLTPLEQPAP